MTATELAARLDGCEYGDEMDGSLEDLAHASGLCVLFGASDDLLECRGSIADERGAGDYTEARLDGDGFLPEFDGTFKSEAEGKRYFARSASPNLVTVLAEWCPQGVNTSWRLSANRPYHSFRVLEDGELYCLGIVIEAPLAVPK